MGTFEIAVVIVLAAILAIAIIALAVAFATSRRVKDAEKNAITAESLQSVREELRDDIDASRRETADNIRNSFSTYGQTIAKAQSEQAFRQNELAKFQNEQAKLQNEQARLQNDRLREMNEAVAEFGKNNDKKIEDLRQTVERQMTEMRSDNNTKLDQMRDTVDEKLQKTLNDRISSSFRIVNERLEQVYKSLGEMQTLAAGVGDLKKVLSNVKTRGILGEVQLGNILEQIMSAEQYEENVATKPGSKDRVEYAIRLPGADDGSVCYLPIDAKFPGDTYQNLLDAYETADPERVRQAKKALEAVVKSEAKDIRDKYIYPPDTTEFGILFVPFEGLYAEIVQDGMIETLLREYHVNIAGPTTMAALLNSLQMGFKTLAIQKNSNEVWKVLGAVKTEFGKFETTLTKAQNSLSQANNQLDELVGVRTRQIQRKLSKVERLDDVQAAALIDDADE
ncbi:MAG: DNA recombination protein RmuC [Eubacterium sp.]|jgi:DNA recombination protein RmuC